MSKRPEALRFQRRLRDGLLVTLMLSPAPALESAIADPGAAHAGGAAARMLIVDFAGLTPAAQGGYRIRASAVSGGVSTAGNHRLHAGALAARIAHGDLLHRDSFETAPAP